MGRRRVTPTTLSQAGSTRRGWFSLPPADRLNLLDRLISKAVSKEALGLSLRASVLSAVFLKNQHSVLEGVTKHRLPFAEVVRRRDLLVATVHPNTFWARLTDRSTGVDLWAAQDGLQHSGSEGQSVLHPSPSLEAPVDLFANLFSAKHDVTYCLPAGTPQKYREFVDFVTSDLRELGVVEVTEPDTEESEHTAEILPSPLQLVCPWIVPNYSWSKVHFLAQAACLRIRQPKLIYVDEAWDGIAQLRDMVAQHCRGAQVVTYASWPDLQKHILPHSVNFVGPMKAIRENEIPVFIKYFQSTPILLVNSDVREAVHHPFAEFCASVPNMHLYKDVRRTVVYRHFASNSNGVSFFKPLVEDDAVVKSECGDLFVNNHSLLVAERLADFAGCARLNPFYFIAYLSGLHFRF